MGVDNIAPHPLLLGGASVVHLTLRVVNEMHRQFTACGFTERLTDRSSRSVDGMTKLRHIVSDGRLCLVRSIVGRAQRDKDQTGRCVSDETRGAK